MVLVDRDVISCVVNVQVMVVPSKLNSQPSLMRWTALLNRLQTPSKLSVIVIRQIKKCFINGCSLAVYVQPVNYLLGNYRSLPGRFFHNNQLTQVNQWLLKCSECTVFGLLHDV